MQKRSAIPSTKIGKPSAESGIPSTESGIPSTREEHHIKSDHGACFVPLASAHPKDLLAPGSGSSWMTFIATMLFIFYLVWLRRKTQLAALVEDKELLSTADYAVRFKGLRVDAPADELGEFLVVELARALNIPPDMIAQATVDIRLFPSPPLTSQDWNQGSTTGRLNLG